MEEFPGGAVAAAIAALPLAGAPTGLATLTMALPTWLTWAARPCNGRVNGVSAEATAEAVEW
uniref:hypothetical protein n=1 Tax=Mycobacterium simiae TaxID=1784 RepID=UPI00358F1F4B